MQWSGACALMGGLSAAAVIWSGGWGEGGEGRGEEEDTHDGPGANGLAEGGRGLRACIAALDQHKPSTEEQMQPWDPATGWPHGLRGLPPPTHPRLSASQL